MIVTVALLAVAAAVFVVSYTNIIEEQRRASDLSNLNAIDVGLKQIFIYDDAFNEIKPYIYDDNKLTIKFTVTNTDGDAYVELSKAVLNDSDFTVESKCPKLYSYMIDQLDEKIDLESSTYKQGSYGVTIAFKLTQVSVERDPTITNDSMQITNSGDSDLYRHESDKE